VAPATAFPGFTDALLTPQPAAQQSASQCKQFWPEI